MFLASSYFITRPFLADYYRRGLEIESTNWSKAITAYQKAISLDPSNAEYHSKLAHFYLRKSKLRRSINNKSKIKNQKSKMHFLNLAKQSYKKAIKLCPKNGNYWLGLGMVYEQLEKFKAESSKVKGSVQPPNTYNLTPTTSHRQQSTVNSQQSTYLLATNCFEKATNLDPNNAFYRTILGSFYIKNSREKEGLKEYEKAIASLPKINLYEFLKGNDVKDEYLDVAIKGLKKAIELYPRNANIHHQLGDIYIKKGMHAEAIKQYQHALKLNPGHKGFKRTLNSLKKQHSSQ